MPYALIIHEVENYSRWKNVFDAAMAMRKQAGEINYRLLRQNADTNQVVHFSEWTSLDQARAFFESPELLEIRKLAGVHAPQFLYLNEVEAGIL